MKIFFFYLVMLLPPNNGAPPAGQPAAGRLAIGQLAGLDLASHFGTFFLFFCSHVSTPYAKMRTILLLSTLPALSFSSLSSISSSSTSSSFSFSYNESLARQDVFYSAASYCNDRVALSNWSCTFCSPPGSATPPLKQVHVLWNESTQIQGFVGYDPIYKRTLIAFRGSVGALDWWEDFDFGLMAYGCSGCEVSTGFHECFSSILPQVRAAVGAIANSFGPSPLYLTGHSLGAAIIELLAYELISTAAPVASVLSFGTPRVGNPAWAAAWSVALQSVPSFRVVHYRDPVPHLPLEAMGFRHPPTEVFYTSESGTSWIACSASNGEDDTCSNKLLPDAPDDHNVYLNLPIDVSVSRPSPSILSPPLPLDSPTHSPHCFLRTLADMQRLKRFL